MGNQQLERDWRKSSYSDTSGECVEVAGGATISVRDTKDRADVELTFTPDHWSAFTASLK
jgi:putative sterol carrier protein